MMRSDNELFENREVCEHENRIEIYHKPGLSAGPICAPKTLEEATGKCSSKILNEISERSRWLPIFHKSKAAVKFLDFAFCFSQLTEHEVTVYWADGFLCVELLSPAMYFLYRSQTMLASLILLCDDFAAIRRGCADGDIMFSFRLESHEIFTR